LSDAQQYGKKKSDVPAGWDWWYGLVGNSKYYNYTLSVNGTWVEFGDRPDDYLTDRISQFALDFLKLQGDESPFLMVIAPPACHDPFTPADRFRDRFANVKVPKGADFNSHYQVINLKKKNSQI
jgi:N-acetylglucosamine-6-sulfatase